MPVMCFSLQRNWTGINCFGLIEGKQNSLSHLQECLYCSWVFFVASYIFSSLIIIKEGVGGWEETV